MATFEAKVYRLTIEEHPNADALELARVGDYRSIVRKGQFKTGDLGVYIPEQSVLPEWLIKELGLEGKLAGKDKNRVKAVRLRGVLSQGLIYPVETMRDVVETNTGAEPSRRVAGPVYCVRYMGGAGRVVIEGDDVTEFLGITKYEPPIPVSMAGEVHGAGGYTIKYDIENLKKYPDVFEEGEPIVLTEKLHGTWCCLGYHPDFGPIVTSKGLSASGLVLKFNVKNETNLYMRALDSTIEQPEFNENGYYIRGTGTNIIDRACMLYPATPIYVLGEVYGKGVQDLTYGDVAPQFRVFDVYIGPPGQGRYLSYEELLRFCREVNVETVPFVALGGFSKEFIEEHTNGKTTLNGEHTREGVVIKPIHEREHDELGRVILKSVSEAYLLRKNGTEYN